MHTAAARTEFGSAAFASCRRLRAARLRNTRLFGAIACNMVAACVVARSAPRGRPVRLGQRRGALGWYLPRWRCLLPLFLGMLSLLRQADGRDLS